MKTLLYETSFARAHGYKLSLTSYYCGQLYGHLSNVHRTRTYGILRGIRLTSISEYDWHEKMDQCR